VALERRCAGKRIEAAEWWQFCDCCESYWRFEVPEPVPDAKVADGSAGFAPGQQTLDADGRPGDFIADWFERAGDCWPA